MRGVRKPNGDGHALEERRTTVVAPTTGGTVWIERVRARPRLQASYAALKGDFRPLALSPDYHNFVNGPLSAHGIVEGAHELLISEDIDSGRSWEIPVLIAHLLESAERLHATGGDEPDVPDIIWATGSVDPELNPQGADYSVARKCEIAADLFKGWQADGRTAHLIVPDGMPDTDVAAVQDVASAHGFQLTIVDDFTALKTAIQFTGDADVSTLQGQPEAVSAANDERSLWQKPAALTAGAVAAAAALWIGVNALPSDDSNAKSGINASRNGGSTTEGTDSPITLIRLGAKDRSDCIERIMLTQPMERTTIPMTDGAYRVPISGGLCGLSFINQSTSALTIRLTGDLVTAAIQGNDALFQGVALPASDATDLIFSRSATGLTASLQLNDAAIPVVIETTEGSKQ